MCDISSERESVKSCPLFLMNSEQKVNKPIQLYRVLPFTAVLLTAKKTGKTGDFSRHAASMPRRERSINLQFDRGITAANG